MKVPVNVLRRIGKDASFAFEVDAKFSDVSKAIKTLSDAKDSERMSINAFELVDNYVFCVGFSNWFNNLTEYDFADRVCQLCNCKISTPIIATS